jgi:hypothetical protein
MNMPATAREHGPARRRQYLAALVVLVIVVTGVVVVAYRQAGRLAWNDEAWVIDYASRPTVPGALHAVLAAGQPISPGYLLLVHELTRFDGQRQRPWEYRVPSAVAALVLLISAGILAGRCARSYALGQGAVLFLLASPLLQRYTGEVKQYLPEAALGLLLLVLQGVWLRSPRGAGAAGAVGPLRLTHPTWATCCGGVAAWAWFAVALVTVLTTFAGWFAVVASGLALAAASLHRSDRARLRLLVPMGAVLGVTALVLYGAFLHHLAGAPVLQESWSNSFLPHDLSLPRKLWAVGVQFCDESWYLYRAPAALMLIAAGLGWLVWCRRDPAAALTAALIVAITFLAGIAHRWPTGSRINLTLIVILHLSIVAGLAGILGSLLARREPQPAVPPAGPARRRMPSPGLAGVMLALAATGLIVYVNRETDFTVAAVDRLLDRLAAEVRPGQVVLADQAACVDLWFRRPALPATVIEVVSEPPANLEALTAARLGPGPAPLPLLAVGHYNAATAGYWQPFLAGPGGCGLIEPIWHDHLVTLFRFTRPPRAEPGGTPTATQP